MFKKKEVTHTDLIVKAKKLELELDEVRAKLYAGKTHIEINLEGEVKLKKYHFGTNKMIFEFTELFNNYDLTEDGGLLMYKGDSFNFSWNGHPIKITGLVVSPP